ncbi:pilus assembly protein PilW [Roseateles sp. DAIF2]|uniref:PilW family protein n=1 Tax=Roseateles sp. DAIF2 TaxID=2714952 RepID=UPI0018A2B833|nr:PilW family protein [Roseateles sp. DAIF2]QPF72546.1 pilus assembly protein PilW [Roseateles sp. DAIF2]
MTLIELMVGLVLGLVVVLVVAQVLGFAEGQKRVTTGGGDAQVNGALALYSLQREIQMAGYGLISDKDVLGCPVKANHATAGALSWNLAPIVITDGANGASDTISILSSSRAYSVPIAVSTDHPTTADRFTVRSAVGVKKGDLVIAVPADKNFNAATNWCSTYRITDIENTNQLVHSGGDWNSAQIAPAGGYPAGSQLMNAGSIVSRTFSVTNGLSLNQQTLLLTTGGMDSQDLFPQIVNMQALYGRDTNGDLQVDVYDNQTPVGNAAWLQVMTVRVALVARSVAYQKDEVTTAQPGWDVGTSVPVAGSADCGASKCLTLKVDAQPDWKHYRYSVYDVIIPLRNMLWRSN